MVIRNFLAGTLWGVVVAGLGLAVVSQVAPLPNGRPDLGADAQIKGAGGLTKPAARQPDVAASDLPTPDSSLPEPPPTAAAPVLDAVAKPKPVQLPTAAPARPAALEPAAPAPTILTDIQMPPTAGAAPPLKPAADSGDDQLALGDAADAPASRAVPTVADAPPKLAAPAAGVADPAPPGTTEPALSVTAPPGPPVADQFDALPPAAEAPPPAPAAEALLDTAPPINATPAPATIVPDNLDIAPPPPPQIAADAPNGNAVPDGVEPAPAGDVSVLQPVAPPEPAPNLIAKDQPSTFVPDAAVTSTADGVTTGRLPRVGDQPAGSTPDPAAPALPAEQSPVQQPADQSPVQQPAEQPPVQRYAQAFDNPSGKPLFAVVLRDTGGPDVDRAALAALPFPVSFVIDPLAPDAAEAAAIYRAAGQEVIMLATGIPAGAQASDLEQTFQSLEAVLPQAVAVMDLATAGFQDDRPLASLVVPIMKAQGRGLITFDRGLNAADQVARRIDVPAATIFRQLDAGGEEPSLIRRYLDRAAFKAAQEGRVTVLGDTKPATIAALMEWAVEGRAASVTLAPVTAVLAVD